MPNPYHKGKGHEGGQFTSANKDGAISFSFDSPQEAEKWAEAHLKQGGFTAEEQAALDAYQTDSTIYQGVSGEAQVAPAAPPAVDQKRVEEVAKSLGFEGKVEVVDQEPRVFEVGTHKFEEAAHYNPADNAITVNARQVSADYLPGLMAHEITHAKWDAVNRERDLEHAEMKALGEEEFNRLWSRSGFIRDEALGEFARRWPVSSLFNDTIGDAYGSAKDHYQSMKKQDGVSDYSRSYWSEEAMKQNFAIDRAINETLAEIARLRLQTGTEKASRRWEMLSKGINKQYARLAALGRVRK